MSTITLTADALASLLQGGDVLDDSWKQTPIGRDVEAYLAYAATRQRGSLAGRRTLLARMSLYFADKTLDQLCKRGAQGRRQLDEFVTRTYPDLADGSRGTYISYLRAFFRWAYDEEIVDRNPAEGLERPKRRERRYVLFSDDEIERLIRSQPASRDRAAIRLVFDLALRSGDLRGLRFRHIDLAHGLVQLDDGKGGTYRELPIRLEATRLEMERHILDRQPLPDEFLLYPEKQIRTGAYPDYEFELRPAHLPRGSEAYQATALTDWWKRCLDRAGIEHGPGEKRIHDARHTTGTAIRKAQRRGEMGGDIDDLRRFMRHKNIATTNLYIHTDEAEELMLIFGPVEKDD